jgi:hypothetical protein
MTTITPEQRTEAQAKARAFIGRVRADTKNALDDYTDGQIWHAIMVSKREGLRLADAVTIHFFDCIMQGEAPESADYIEGDAP